MKPKESWHICDNEMYFLWKTKMEYSGFWVSLEGVIPINKNGSNKKVMPMTY